jgi:hypothetical protein
MRFPSFLFLVLLDGERVVFFGACVSECECELSE